MNNPSVIRPIVFSAYCAMLLALSGCGGGGGSGAAMPPAAPPAAGTSFEGFVRDVLTQDPSGEPREINDVPLSIDVRDDSFDDAFPA